MSKIPRSRIRMKGGVIFSVPSVVRRHGSGVIEDFSVFVNITSLCLTKILVTKNLCGIFHGLR